MTVTKKPAGEARERPRPVHRTDPHHHGHGPDIIRKSVGTAPVFDAATKRLAPAGEAPRGMISNPWVRFWSGAGPAPVAQTVARPAAAAHAQKKDSGEGRGASSKGGKEGQRKKSLGRQRKERGEEP
jgi:hypothetical protein